MHCFQLLYVSLCLPVVQRSSGAWHSSFCWAEAKWSPQGMHTSTFTAQLHGSMKQSPPFCWTMENHQALVNRGVNACVWVCTCDCWCASKKKVIFMWVNVDPYHPRLPTAGKTAAKFSQRGWKCFICHREGDRRGCKRSTACLGLCWLF